MKEYKYRSIEVNEEGPTGDDKNDNAIGSTTARTKSNLLGIVASVAASFVILLVVISLLSWRNTSPPAIEQRPFANSIDIPMPSGVNFGSWLSLEDYFFASGASKEVATPFGKTQASCLPPLHTGRWQSETDLLATMSDEIGLPNALQAIHAHRLAFIDLDEDLSQLQQLGIRRVRVPLSWCLTDMDPDKDGITKANAHQYICQDPFFEEEKVVWPAIPKALIVRLLRACAKYDILATLDLHTYPGATSIGTFSGLWPRWPRFWLHDQPESPQSDLGRGLLRDFVKWMELLAEEDPLAFEGLGAISPMNEPAHLAGLFAPNDTKAFLPELPIDVTKSFLNEIEPTSKDQTRVPAGPHLRVLLWLSNAVQTFRESSLQSLGKELHVNIHESIFSPTVLPPGDGDDDGGRHPGATEIIASWWRSATTTTERQSWAVLDMHHYHAWEPACAGTVDGRGNYTCGDNEATSDALNRCSSWANMYRAAIDRECGPGAKLASAEFSASTHHEVRHACNDVTTLRASYLAQVNAAERANVDLYFWSFKMPYGGAFRSAWSFKQLLYLLGVTAHPDTPTFDCGQHVEQQDEPSDDEFT